jgi:hypothetical protein
MTTRFIVAEVSKKPFLPDTMLLAQQFEEVVNTNYQRGYRLHSFSLHRLT